jgi:hypothetical protein
LKELHARSRVTATPPIYDWSFELQYPEEIPMQVLQTMMFKELVAIRNENLPPVYQHSHVEKKKRENSMDQDASSESTKSDVEAIEDS